MLLTLYMHGYTMKIDLNLVFRRTSIRKEVCGWRFNRVRFNKQMHAEIILCLLSWLWKMQQWIEVEDFEHCFDIKEQHIQLQHINVIPCLFLCCLSKLKTIDLQLVKLLHMLFLIFVKKVFFSLIACYYWYCS